MSPSSLVNLCVATLVCLKPLREKHPPSLLKFNSIKLIPFQWTGHTACMEESSLSALRRPPAEKNFCRKPRPEEEPPAKQGL